MNILIIGSGGREHAFAWKIKQSKHCKNLFVSPGNAGTSEIAKNVTLNLDRFEEVGEFCLKNNIHILLIGPEDPLVNGMVDHFRASKALQGIHVIGPSQKGATLEGSKDFAKQFMQKYHIPTAKYRTFTNENFVSAIDHLSTHTLPIVIKADGLAAGKGVVICETSNEAKEVITSMIKKEKFGKASSKVVVEQFLKGIELSVFVATDGKSYTLLPEAKDYKRIGEGDSGPNTGGMGAVSPVIFADKKFMDKVEEKIIRPTIEGLKKENIDYKGFVFFGLINVNGEPFVIEYNCRMGDPETEVVIPRIKSDFVELLLAISEGKLDSYQIEIDERAAVTIMMVAEGYPEAYEKGRQISGIETVEYALPFQAATTFNEKHQIVTNGGRVISVTAMDENLSDALHKAYKEVAKISWSGVYFRKDIGHDLLSLSY